MADLTQEIYDSLPEAVQGDYELNGEVYVTKDSLKVGALKTSLNNAYGERDEIGGKLSAYEQTKADEIEQAKKEAYEKAIADNDFVAQAKMLEEKRLEAEQAKELSVAELENFRASIAKDNHELLVSELLAHATEESRPLMAIAFRNRTSVDPLTQKRIYLDAGGSATDLDDKGFVESLKSDPVFKPYLLAELVTTGTGQANGSLGGGASSKSPKDMTSLERLEFKQRDPVGFRKHFKL